MHLKLSVAATSLILSSLAANAYQQFPKQRIGALAPSQYCAIAARDALVEAEAEAEAEAYGDTADWEFQSLVRRLAFALADTDADTKAYDDGDDHYLLELNARAADADAESSAAGWDNSDDGGIFLHGKRGMFDAFAKHRKPHKGLKHKPPKSVSSAPHNDYDPTKDQDKRNKLQGIVKAFLKTNGPWTAGAIDGLKIKDSNGKVFTGARVEW